MHLPTITIVDRQEGVSIDLDTADVEALVNDYTASELATMAALLKVAMEKVTSAGRELSVRNAGARLQRGPFDEPIPPNFT